MVFVLSHESGSIGDGICKVAPGDFVPNSMQNGVNLFGVGGNGALFLTFSLGDRSRKMAHGRRSLAFHGSSDIFVGTMSLKGELTFALFHSSVLDSELETPVGEVVYNFG